MLKWVIHIVAIRVNSLNTNSVYTDCRCISPEYTNTLFIQFCPSNFEYSLPYSHNEVTVWEWQNTMTLHVITKCWEYLEFWCRLNKSKLKKILNISHYSQVTPSRSTVLVLYHYLLHNKIRSWVLFLMLANRSSERFKQFIIFTISSHLANLPDPQWV
jgi:hypothetical protein